LLGERGVWGGEWRFRGDGVVGEGGVVSGCIGTVDAGLEVEHDVFVGGAEGDVNGWDGVVKGDGVDVPVVGVGGAADADEVGGLTGGGQVRLVDFEEGASGVAEEVYLDGIDAAVAIGVELAPLGAVAGAGGFIGCEEDFDSGDDAVARATVDDYDALLGGGRPVEVDADGFGDEQRRRLGRHPTGRADLSDDDVGSHVGNRVVIVIEHSEVFLGERTQSRREERREHLGDERHELDVDITPRRFEVRIHPGER